MNSTDEEKDPLDAAAALAKRVLRENQARAEKLKNVLCILQGKQEGAKSALEEVVTRHAEAVATWKAAFRQVIDAQYVNKAKLLQDQMAVVRRASIGLHTSLERLEALRLSPAAAAAVPAVTDVIEKYIAESREVCPDRLLDFAFREVPPDRWARSRLAVGYLQTSSLCPTDLTLEEMTADGLTVTFRAKSERPYDAATVTNMSYSVLDEEGKEVTEVVWVDSHDGCFSATFRAAAPKPHVVSVYLYSVHVNGSPLRVHVGGSNGSAALIDASSQTLDPLADADFGEEGEDFVGWMRARLEREISQSSCQALMEVEGGPVARPVCRPQVGSGRLLLPLHTSLDPNNNREPANRVADGGGAGDGPTQEAKREIRRPVAPPPLKKSSVAGTVSGLATSVVPSATKSTSAVPSKASGVSSSTCSIAGSATNLTADFSRMTIPGEPVDSLRRPTSTNNTAPAPPVIQITVQQESSRPGSPERVVTERNTRQVVEEFRRAVDENGNSPMKRETNMRTHEEKRSYNEPGREWDDTTINGCSAQQAAGKAQKKSGTRASAPDEDSGTGCSAASPNESGRGLCAQKQLHPRGTAPRPLRTVRVTSDDLAAATAPPDLARGSVSGKLDLLLRPTPLFNRPIGIAARGDTLYIADTGNDSVRVFSADGAELECAAPTLRRPSALAVLSEDRLAVRYDQGVRVYAVPPGGQWRLLYQLGSGLLKRPFGLAVTSTERLVTVDGTRGRPTVHVFDASPSGQGRQVHSVDIGQHVLQPETAKLYFVAASETRVAVTDLGNNVVLLLNWEGRLVARVGEGVARGARLYDPAGLALDAAGNLLVADSKHHRIVIFASDGSPRGCVEVSHKLNRPSGICLQGGMLHVLNYWDNTAHRYQLAVSEQ